MGQRETEQKWNEIMALAASASPGIEGAGDDRRGQVCPKAIAKKIVEQGGDDALELKENQEKIREAVKDDLQEWLNNGFARGRHNVAKRGPGAM